MPPKKGSQKHQKAERERKRLAREQESDLSSKKNMIPIKKHR